MRLIKYIDKCEGDDDITNKISDQGITKDYGNHGDWSLNKIQNAW